MKKILIAVLAASFLATSVYAVDISVSGNAAGSQNNVSIDQGSTQTVQQGNSGTVDNNINATANTGGNNVSGNSNGNNIIKTGDSTIKTTVTNQLNSNNAQVTCSNCATPTVQPTQAPQPTATPAPSGDGGGNGGNGGNGSGNGGSSNSNGSSNGSNGGIGGGDVLGLSATSGESTQQFFTIAGTVCLILGSALFNLKRIRV